MTTLPQSTPYYGGGQVQNPCNKFQGTGVPSANIAAKIGDTFTDYVNGNMYGAVSKSGSSITWSILGGATSAIATINSLPPTAGNIVIAGTANQITMTSSGSTITASLPSALTVPGSLTATLGNITATAGNFVSSAAGNGIVLNSGTASGTTTATLNGRSGQVTITTPTINAGATFSFALTNSSITSSSTQVLYGLTGGTTGSAITIQSVTNSGSTSTVVVQNASAVTNSIGSLVLTFLVLN